MRIVVTGARGMLGSVLTPLLKVDHEVVELTRKDCDLTDQGAVRQVLRINSPDLVIHLAALANVDGCEREPEKAKAWNATATLNVAIAAKDVGAEVLYTSTDYVFDGCSNEPYDEGAFPRPLSVYGETKLMGEKFVQETLDRYFIVRTSWLFGPHGRNFVTTILRLANENPELRVVNDQRGSPTYTRHLAEKLAELVMTREYGIYHLTAEGNCTWFEFALKIIDLSGLDPVQVLPITSWESGRPATRPAYSVLANRRFESLGMSPLPSWEEGLSSYLAEIHDGGCCADKNIGKRPAYSEPA